MSGKESQRVVRVPHRTTNLVVNMRAFSRVNAASGFIPVLEEEIKRWNEAALRCDSVIALLPGEKQKIEWIMIAASYRHRAKDLETMIDKVRKAEGGR